MFAILITEETLPKIFEVESLTERDKEFLPTCVNKDRYFIRGYYPEHGKPLPWTFYFGKKFRELFEYDEVKIQTDWDQIVRK